MQANLKPQYHPQSMKKKIPSTSSQSYQAQRLPKLQPILIILTKPKVQNHHCYPASLFKAFVLNLKDGYKMPKQVGPIFSDNPNNHCPVRVNDINVGTSEKVCL